MRLLMLPALAFLLASASCANNSGFKGGGGQRAQPVEVAKPAEDKQEPDERPSVADAPGKPDPQVPKLPENAVTRGSFTAWADPARPAPRQAYWIYIEVKLPSNVGGYQVNDLSGRLVGTDGYTRGVGRDSRGALDGAFIPPWANLGTIPQDQFQVNAQTARIAVWVPGAEELVRDTVSIRSDLLNENQSLEIVFQ